MEYRKQMLIEERIVKNPQWLYSVKKQADEKGIPIDSMIHLNARYTLKEHKKKDDADIQFFEQQIRTNAEWLEIVEEKAKKKGISLDSMIELDAKFLMKMSKEKQAK